MWYRRLKTAYVNEDNGLAATPGLWTLSDMLPKIVVTNADLDVHGMAQYFEQMHRDESVDVVRFLRKFVRGTLVKDLRRLAGRWNELPGLDNERIAALTRRDIKEGHRIALEIGRIGVALSETKDPRTGKITTNWKVEPALVSEPNA